MIKEISQILAEIELEQFERELEQDRHGVYLKHLADEEVDVV